MKLESGKTIFLSTIIDSCNYGTVLQAVATKESLSSYGKVKFVDYCRPWWTFKGWLLNSLRRNYGFAASAKLMVQIPLWFFTKRIFRRFIKENLDLVDSKKFLTGNGVFPAEAIYCVGSDQTWNYAELNEIDPVYTLARVPSSCKKIAFSASFGRDCIPDREAAEMYPLLKQFSAISVRESSSVAVTEAMGIHNAVALKDPVLTCNPDLWRNLASRVREASSRYVLVYMLNSNQRMLAYAKRLASSKGLGVRVITFSPWKPAPKGCESVFLPTPEEWLANFRDARYVVTDSFHGTCFSILFEKPMVVFNPPKYSVRLTDVLKDFELADRRVPDDAKPSEIRIADRPIDWNHVRGLLNGFRHEAQIFLKECIGHE